jgi:hypothetical protein
MGTVPGLSDPVSLPESGSGSIGLITLDVKRAGKPYEGKPHVRFDEKVLEIGYGRDAVTLPEETGRNGEHKHRPAAATPVLYLNDAKNWQLINSSGGFLKGI